MEGKSIAVTLLLLSLVVGQIQVEAESSCPSTTARNCYNACRLTGLSQQTCANLCGCKIQVPPCPSDFNHSTLENTGDAVNEYCKLGCSVSVCGAMTTIQNSGEVVNGAVEKCNNACSAFCTKNTIIAKAETA